MLIALIIFLWIAIQTSPVQNWIVKQVTENLSSGLQTTVTIRHVNFSLFDNMHLEGVLIKDHQKDTLLAAGEITVNITDWFFFKDKIVLKNLGIKDATIKLTRNDSIWNYAFLVDYFSGSKKSESSKPIQFGIGNINLENIHITQHDAWRGEDEEISLEALVLETEHFDLDEKNIHIRLIDLTDPLFVLKNYDGNRPEQIIETGPDEKIVNNPLNLRWNPGKWNIVIDELRLKNGKFNTSSSGDIPSANYFDGSNIDFYNITGTLKNIRLLNDSITVMASLKAKERSGLEVTKLDAAIRFHPEAMEFANLDLRTPRSRLHNFFAMRYRSFDDLGEFISKVTMEGNFNGSELSSDDIAYFAPALKNFKNKIRIDGKIRGTVADLHAKNLVIAAGNSTYLNGNLRITGLPDIEKTYIDFTANNFRTTYADVVSIIPQLKKITQPRIDLLQYLRFTGNFTGFLTDFVTSGTLETNLGTLVTDVNLKIPTDGNTSYSGNIQTNDFELGKFIETSEVGRISFKGMVSGNGINENNLSAKLDGTVSRIEVNGYGFQNIIVKGTIAKKLFNGELTSNDPNLDATLNGLVDFSQNVPKFDFNATIAKADLKKINLTDENIEFNGKFRFDFHGNTIDNFLGTAHILDANLVRNGTRLNFDSLSVESKVVDSNKVITVLSNEFDAALVGEFSIKDLPASFQTFLNKYYPSYISPSRSLPKNENFSFVITTKNVQDYMDLFVKNLKGFNYSTLTGRINNKENLLDLNAEIPQFSYKNISLYDLTLKASGTLNNLAVESGIGDIYINDSLHFPGTSISLNSSNDTSNVIVKTSANQTLNSANISAKVNTRSNGISIFFKESNFNINGKNWTIDKNGELVLSKDLVFADGVRIFNGQQEIHITTVPSDISNTNDIRIELLKLSIGDFAPYVITSNRLEGLLTGTVDIIDPFGKLQIDAKGVADQFRLDDDSVGRIQWSTNYNQKTGAVNFNGVSDNHDYRFDLKGVYNILDSTSDKQLDIVTNLTETRISPISKYLTSVFSSVDGLATGQLRIVGSPKSLNYLGKIGLKEGKLTVAFTNVTYTIPQASFDFKEDMIDFGTFFIRDSLGNVGTLSRGKLRHRSFDNLDFDFALNTNKLLVLNTNNLTKDPFYGKIIAKVNLVFTGPLEDMLLNIKAEPADSSDFFIRSGTSRESGQADFIVWKTYGREMDIIKSEKESKLTLLLDVTANNLVKMNVIIDEMTNDVMTAIGHGNLKIQANTAGLLNMTGQFDIERGNYNFNFQSLLRKPFVLKGDAGSYIRWSGNASDADINVLAEYEADNVKFSDLGTQIYSQGGSETDYIKKYRGKVQVQAKLTGKLMKPDIAFALKMPDNSPLKNDPIVLNLLRTIEADENELTKQVAFLIIFNSFGPTSTGTSQSSLAGRTFEGIVSSSISGYISNAINKQFSSIVKKLLKDESIQVNFNAQFYNGSYLLEQGNSSAFAIDRTSLNFSLAKSVFNERLTFTFGSALDFGLTAEQAKATNNLQFLPDFSADFKIRPDGKLLLTFFYRDTYSYETASGKQNRAGAGISYRRNFEHISDIWKSDRKKKKPKAIPVDSSQNIVMPPTASTN